MSYILEALKKKNSDQDKNVPDLSSHHYQGDFVEESNSNNKLLLWTFGVLLLLLALFMMYQLGKSDSSSDNIQLTSPPVVGNPEAEKLKVETNTIQKEQLSNRASSLNIESAPIEIKAPVVEKIKHVAKKVEQAATLPIEVSAAKSITINDKNVSGETSNNWADNSTIASEVSADSDFSALPGLRYNTHVYADNPADRFISLNGKTYGIGEQLPNGVRIEDILEDDLLISYRKKTYKIPSLTDINQ